MNTARFTVKMKGRPSSLTPKEKRVLRSLMRRKLYDRNHPEDRRFLIVARAFVPSDFMGRPVVVLLCRWTAPDPNGLCDYAIFTDGLFGKGHWPSDKFGYGTPKTAYEAFRDHVLYELVGVQPWVIEKAQATVRRIFGP